MGGSARRWVAFSMVAAACAACGDAPDGPADGAEGPAAPTEAELELDVAFPMALGHVSTIRELEDGSLLVADPTAPALLRMDFQAGTLDTLGREGDGPEEYRQPDKVFALPGDSTVMVDLGRLRLTFLDAGGEFVGGMSMTTPRAGTFPTTIQPEYTDGAGRLYYWGNRAAEDALPDSVAVVRFDRGTLRHDTVALVWLPPFVREDRGGRSRVVEVMLNPSDGWAVADDGSLAIVRANGYSVDWIRPDGSRTVGPPNPFPPHPVRRAEQEAEMGEMAENAIVTMIMAGGGGVESMRMSRGMPRGNDGPTIEDLRWAETLPIFRAASARISPRGDVWVERRSPAGEAGLLDVFDGAGTRIAEVALPPNRRLVGFGGGGDVAYLVRRDELDLKWLERYRVPSALSAR